MPLSTAEIFQIIGEKERLGYPEEEISLDVFGYSLQLDSKEPLNTNLGDTRKILPFQGKICLNRNKNDFRILEVKNGKALKKEVMYKPSYKPSLSLFLSEEEMLIDYNKTAKEEIKKLEAGIKSYLNAIEELKEAGK